MAASRSRASKSLYLQVLAGVVLGAALGHFWPAIAVQMQPFGDAFIKLVRMIIAPIVFVTVVLGIAKLSDAKEVGRIGIKAVVYFEVMTTIAMFIGLIVGHVIQPGTGLNIDPATSTFTRCSSGGLVGGLQFGENFQIKRLVLGIGADLLVSEAKSESATSQLMGAAPPPGTYSLSGKLSPKDFAIIGDTHFDVLQGVADGADVVWGDDVVADYGRGFRQAVALGDGEADGGEEFGEFGGQRGASGDKQAHAAADSGAKLLVD